MAGGGSVMVTMAGLDLVVVEVLKEIGGEGCMLLSRILLPGELEVVLPLVLLLLLLLLLLLGGILLWMLLQLQQPLLLAAG